VSEGEHDHALVEGECGVIDFVPSRQVMPAADPENARNVESLFIRLSEAVPGWMTSDRQLDSESVDH